MAQDNNDVPTACKGGYHNSTSNNRTWKFSVKIKTAKGEINGLKEFKPEDKAAVNPPNLPPKKDGAALDGKKDLAVSASVPIFYLTANSIINTISGYPTRDKDDGSVQFKASEFTDNDNSCENYTIENFPPDPKKQVEGKG